MTLHHRPFDVTKAVDFSDAEIAATWVDLGEGGLLRLLDPAGPMPVVLLGGKGSGRTHLMRYCSFALQQLRTEEGESAIDVVRREGYLGIYMRCEGLNAGRFGGKGQSPERWDAVFSHYMDLWLSEIALATIRQALPREMLAPVEARIVADICDLFDERINATRLEDVATRLTEIRRQVDLAVNNAALTLRLDGVRIVSTRGKLVFGVPKCFQRHIPALADVSFVYIMDELENLSVEQQMYVNTLVREREPPCSIRIGARLHGLRTSQTLSAGEHNRAGSEFELVLLDDHLRASEGYEEFATKLVALRLKRAGYPAPGGIADEHDWVRSHFETFPASRFDRDQTRFVAENYEEVKDRPYFARLHAQLEEHSDADPRGVVAQLACPEFPLIEKVNVFLLYQDWAARRDLMSSADAIGKECRRLLEDGRSSRHKHVLGHFKADLLAQLLRDCRQRQRYFGFDSFVAMSSGIPRHLLIVLKFVHRWSLFNGETPFAGQPVSFAAQRSGVTQAANWFLDESCGIGADELGARGAIDRLARLFHQLRFADKPVESSLTTFAYDPQTASEESRRTLRTAQEMSLLLRIAAGGKGRNDEGVLERFQLNPMLAPRYDLPLARRGTIDLSAAEVDAVFGSSDEAPFAAVLATRLGRVNVPFRAQKPEPVRRGAKQPRLPGMD